MNYEYHEYANIFPIMTGSDFADLVFDIRSNGQIEPVILYENKILDGRNRYNACKEIGIRPIYEYYKGNDPLSFVISLNLNRRHLNESQRAMVGAKLANMKSGTRTDLTSDEFSRGLSNKDASNKLNVGIDSVKKAKKVQKEGIEDLQKSVETGRISVNAAAQIASLPKEDQESVVAKGEDEILKMATKIRQQRSAESKKQKDEMRKQALAVKPPQGKYRTIVIDPPWDMQRIQMENRTFDNESFDYPTMSLEEIKEMQLPAHDECHLWLWTTQKYLRPSFEILDSWGFTYLATFVWHKNGGFQPVGLPQFNCEFVLLARKGAQPFVETKQFFTCFNAPRREHSRKPDEFYDVVNRVCPEPRIDMFSRENRDGYDVWGLETGMFENEF